MVRFSKFTLNINIYDEFVGFLSKLVWRATLFISENAKKKDVHIKKEKRNDKF